MGVVPCPTDFTDAHRFHRCTQIFLRSPDVSSHADFADFYLFTLLNSHTDLTDFFTFLPFYLKKVYKMLTPIVSFPPMKHLNHRNETIF